MRFPHALPICGLIHMLMFGGALGSYFTGGSPVSYYEGDELKVRVNKLTSLSTPLPHSYYSLPHCRPENIKDGAWDFGDMVFGDRSQNSPYKFKMLEAQKCVVVCRVKLNSKSAKELQEAMEDEYKVNMSLDDLPLGVPTTTDEEDMDFYQLGFNLGAIGRNALEPANAVYLIYNHLSFVIKYNKDLQQNSTNIVGFTVRPFSRHHKYRGKWSEKTRLTTCQPLKGLSSDSPQMVNKYREIVFTYDVAFEESNVKWASRWDAYVIPRIDEVNWFSILNSLAIVLLLSVKVAVIMLQSLLTDASKLSDLDAQEEPRHETGWKSVHGDVFRPPKNPDLFCACISSGIQIFGMVLGTLLLGVLGFFLPSNQDDLLSAIVLLWVLMGLFAGYSCTRLHTMFQGTKARYIVAVWNAIALPAATCLMSSVLSIHLTKVKFSAAISCWHVVRLFAWGFLVSAPLIILGTYTGFQKPPIAYPVKTNILPREIPYQAWYRAPRLLILIGGMLPFVVAFNEVFHILTSVSMHLVYSRYDFLFLVFLILIITCAEMSIILCYSQLCNNNYHWWWQSFLTAGSSAIYYALYATYYLFFRLDVTKTAAIILYLGYILITASASFLMNGSVGFLACLWFNRLIYSSLKID